MNRFAAAVTLLVSAACASPAVADPSDQKAAAQVLFEQGRALVEAGHFEDACPKFAESERLDPGLGTMLWLADCYESMGHTASAWAAFKQAAGGAALRRDPREQVARDRAASLEPKLSRLSITVSDEAAVHGLHVQRDGMQVGSAEWGLAVPLDPGTHTIAANAPGYRPWSTAVHLGPGPVSVQVSVPLLDRDSGGDTARTVMTPAADAPADATTPAHAQEPSGGATQRTAGLIVGGAGVLGLVVGTVYAFVAKATYDTSNNGPCDPITNRCTPAGAQDRNEAGDQAMVANVAMGIGAAAVAGGALLYLLAPSAGQPKASVALTPAAGGGALRLRCAF
jgi:serine/threonine-protein kinase